MFNNIYEYPILIVFALLVLPGMFADGLTKALQRLRWLVAAAVAAGLWFAIEARLPGKAEMPIQVASCCWRPS